MATRLLEPLPVPSGAAVLGLLPALDDALAGRGPAWLPVPAHDEAAAARLVDALDGGGPVDGATAVVLATSGSTGTPKGALCSGTALRASADATHERLGGPGTWLSALPAEHVAGLQVLVRGIRAGTEPVVVAPGFAPRDLVAAVARMPAGRRYTALVPTQLRRVLDDLDATAALAALDGVLVGGAATPTALLERARRAAVTVVCTYGMSETCGGCVYDGVPLDGVTVAIDDGAALVDGAVLVGGTVLVGGATLASGYRNRPGHRAWARPGWFRTDDAGMLHGGVLTVLGRRDEAITTGGLTVAPAAVEAVLATHPLVRECAVLGVPDETWGARVVAVVVPGDVAPTLVQLQAHVGAVLGREAVPRELHLRAELPVRGPGKIDRRALAAQLHAR